MYRAAEQLVEIPISFSPKQVYRLQKHRNDRSQEDFKGLLQQLCPCKTGQLSFCPSGQKWILHLGFLPESSWDHPSVSRDNPGSILHGSGLMWLSKNMAFRVNSAADVDVMCIYKELCYDTGTPPAPVRWRIHCGKHQTDHSFISVFST